MIYIYETSGVRDRQMLLLLLTGFFSFFFLLFFIVDFSCPTFFLFLVELSLVVGVNYLFCDCYDIKIDSDGVIHAHSLWSKKEYLTSDLHSIRVRKFLFPYPYNPFLLFSFKNGRQLIVKIKNPAGVYLSDSGIGGYLNKLMKDIKSISIP